ncbi:MAG: tRNA cyclic N6-threonylcarbamoyladenosine(37) synthase TcdA [Algicola sp.]|nr:tRNA cyclic N6-threonylcarbamoyladenosine(37) synthase TcdA [Algicola sp.]
MPEDIKDIRFGGIKRLYGHSEADILWQSHVCVVGIGGVGSWVAEALARTGIGHITLIDMDDICATNINRQIHALTDTIGQQKIEAMQARIYLINPECKVDLIDDFVSPENIREYISKDFDYVVDAIDSVKAKTALIAYCKRNKIPVITTGGAGGQTDPTKIEITDVAKTIQDPLMSKVRSSLRRDYNFSKNVKRKFGVDCVYSTEQLMYPNSDGTVCHAKSNAEGSMKLDCNAGFGAVSMVTASFGFVAASRVVKKIIGKKMQS